MAVAGRLAMQFCCQKGCAETVNHAELEGALLSDLPGYVLHIIGKDDDFTLLRGRRSSDERPVLVLRPRSTTPSTEILKRLENQFAIASDLDPAWAVCPIELVRGEKGPALILDDPGGMPLDESLGEALELSAFLRLSVNLAEALRQIHLAGIIHKDIKPANLLVDEKDIVRVMGFGIASRLTRERRVASSVDSIAGTLAYIAPEQTGRMNRSVDIRSDLYSMGVTLYEMLTGRLPFEAADAVEWIHCHIARQPLRPEVQIDGAPAPVGDVIMKLLAKNAEDRYQTASGVLADLRRCQADWQSHQRIDAFSPGENDGLDHLFIPERLYGRQSDVDALINAFERVAEGGSTEMVLVSGGAGVGKSSAVNELHRAIATRRGLFARVKFDQYKRDIPYGALTQALRDLVQAVLGENDDELARWRTRLMEALGQNAQSIIRLVPQLELIIGKQPQASDLSPDDARLRFQTLVGRFIGAFARSDHPLVIFFDDLHWSDPDTLDLLRILCSRNELGHLLLVGAYRDNEVGSDHHLTATLADIEESKVPIRRLWLANLALGDLTALIAGALRCDPQRARPLAQLVHAKTGGNPFFVIQFLTSLEHDGLLEFSVEKAGWTWDIGQIARKRFTDNVVDLMVARLNRLPGHVQKALRHLACIGNGARADTLSALYQDTREVLEAALWEAVRLEFVSVVAEKYSFVHDRIQEAAYSSIPEAERAHQHLRTARVLARALSQQEVDEKIFDLVEQYNRSAHLIESSSEREQVARFNLTAGIRAKASTAYAAALQYFTAGATALQSVELGPASHSLNFELELNRAECEILTGDHEAAAKRLDRLAGVARSATDRSAVARLRMILYTTIDRIDRAIAVGLEYLRRAGIGWSPHPSDEEVDRDLSSMWRLLGERRIEEMIDLPLLQDAELLATIDVLADFLAPASFTDNNLFYLSVIRMANLSLAHGNCDASACAYALLSIVLGLRQDDYDAAFRFGQLGCDLVDKRGLDRFKAKVHTFFGALVLPWARPYSSGREVLRRAIEEASASGDLTYAAYSVRSLVTNLLVSGVPLAEVEWELETALSSMRGAKFGLAIDSLVAQLLLVRSLRGERTDVGLFPEADGSELAFERRLMQAGAHSAVGAARYHICKLQQHFMAGEMSEALAAARNAQGLVWSTEHFLEIGEYHFYSALTLAAAYEGIPLSERQDYIEAIETHRTRIARWSKGCQENQAHREALLAAEIARLRGKASEAIKLYEVAIRSAHENGFVQHEAIAAELAGRFYRALGADTAALGYLRRALAGYKQWGAMPKVRQLEELDPDATKRGFAEKARAEHTPEHLDFTAIMKTSLAVSGEIVLDRLIERIMAIALEHAGADRGLLILSGNEDAHIEAEAQVVGGVVRVKLQHETSSPNELCQSILRYVLRTQQTVLLDDAMEGQFATDAYIRSQRIRSLMCLPLTKQSSLIGALYLENRLTTHAFTPERTAVLRALASQAANALENARLYADLKTTQDRLQASHDEMQMLVSVVENSSDFIGYLPTKGRDGYINAGGRRMVGIELDADVSRVQISDLRPAEEDDRYLREILPALERDGRWTGERNLRHFKTNEPIPVLQNLFYIIDSTTGERRGTASICKDLTEQRRTDEALRKAQADLENIARRMTMGEFAASVAHELNQPLMAIVASGETCMLRLDKSPPEIEKARAAAQRVIRDGHRASEVIKSIRALLKKAPSESLEFEPNRAIRDVIDLTQARIRKEGILLDVDLRGMVSVLGDRGQFQQVVLNLVANAIDAMVDVMDQKRLLRIETREIAGCLAIGVEDSGRGIDPGSSSKIYDAFFTTKPEGMGMGLAISRSIVEKHGGRLWAEPRQPNGSKFIFEIPVAVSRASVDPSAV
ncbi:trifunctional serine/threonine-protein kinase/ATP-binding protein/sensor histidine kinase [Bradyrhizobium guangzhouense]|nr:AAA family ATPase [Bradyrhizobium guangzhouense]